MFNKKISLTYLTLFLLLALEHKAHSDESLHIHFGTASHGSEVMNAYINYLKFIYHKAGYTLEVSRLPSKRAMEEANSGHIDGVILLPEVILQKYKNLILVKPSLATIDTMLYTSDSTPNLFNVSNLKAKTVGFIRGYEVTEMLIKGEKTVALPGYKPLFSMLSNSRIDVALALRRESHRFLSKNMNIGNFKMYSVPIYSTNIYHFINKKHNKIAQKISSIMRQPESKAHLKKLTYKYKIERPSNVTAFP